MEGNVSWFLMHAFTITQAINNPAMVCTTDGARAQRLHLCKWISHLSRTHLNWNDRKACGYGSNYRRVSLNPNIIVLSIPWLSQHIESLRVQHTRSIFFHLNKSPSFKITKSLCKWGTEACRVALLLKSDLRDRQTMHHLTEQKKSNPWFWRFWYNKALTSSLRENTDMQKNHR